MPNRAEARRPSPEEIERDQNPAEQQERPKLEVVQEQAEESPALRKLKEQSRENDARMVEIAREIASLAADETATSSEQGQTRLAELGKKLKDLEGLRNILASEKTSEEKWLALREKYPDVRPEEFGIIPELAAQALGNRKEAIAPETSHAIRTDIEAADEVTRAGIPSQKMPERLNALLAERAALNRETRSADRRAVEAGGFGGIAESVRGFFGGRTREWRVREIDREISQLRASIREQETVAEVQSSAETVEAGKEFGSPAAREFASRAESELNGLLAQRAEANRSLRRLDDEVNQATGFAKARAVARRFTQSRGLRAQLARLDQAIDAGRVAAGREAGADATEVDVRPPERGVLDPLEAEKLVDDLIAFGQDEVLQKKFSEEDFRKYQKFFIEAIRAKDEIETAMERDGRRPPNKRFEKKWQDLLTEGEAARLRDIIDRRKNKLAELKEKYRDPLDSLR